jgi:predicted RNA polymerase sigma factor
MIAEAVALIERAGALRRVGPYQVEAAIAAVHAEAPSYDATDWVQIVALYDLLLSLAPSPVGRLNRAIALGQIAGPGAALEEVDGLLGALHGYHLFHAARAELLTELGRTDQARLANQRARDLTANPAERRLLQRRLRRERSGARPPAPVAAPDP